jgi:hypothetical protein
LPQPGVAKVKLRLASHFRTVFAQMAGHIRKKSSPREMASPEIAVAVYNVGGGVKEVFFILHFVSCSGGTPVASRAGSEVKGAPRSGAFIEDP